MSDYAETARRFLELHRSETPLLIPNPWDLGSAKLLAWVGFKALATTSGGFAASLGRRDGTLTREEAVAHAGAVAAATGLPVNGDLENGFGDGPAGVAATITLALEAGVAGCSIEDWSGSEIYDVDFAAERVAAAAKVAHAGPVHLVLTARAENHFRAAADLDDTIGRLRTYQAAGADVLFAPGLRTIEDISAVVAAVDRPVSVVALPGVPSAPELARVGVSRVSIGAAFALVAYGALVEAATELRDTGTYSYLDGTARSGRASLNEAFAPDR